MLQLHLHAITLDFEGPGLKKPSHWRSFQEPFFRPIDRVCKEVEEYGQPTFDVARIEAAKSGALRCHWCQREQANLPRLREHLTACPERPGPVLTGAA